MSPAPAPAPPRWLRLIALAEPLTLAVLLFNVAVAHDAQVAAAIGPVHGGCYLTIIIGLLVREGTSSKVRLLSLLPGIGGLLALRAPDHARPPVPGSVTKTPG